MPSTLSPSVSAVTLAALLLCAHAASLGNAPTVSPAEDSSGEQDDPTGLESGFNLAVRTIQSYENDIPAEIQNTSSTKDLNECRISLPAECPFNNFSKEACLQRLVHGLQTYIVLLTFVESEYPINRGTRFLAENLNKQLTNEMKNRRSELKELSSEERQRLNNINTCYKDTFNRKVAANLILKKLYEFLTRGKRAVVNRKTPRARRDKRSASPGHLYYQLLNSLR